MKTVCIDTGHVPGMNVSPCVPAYSEGREMALLGEMLGATLQEYYDDCKITYTRKNAYEVLRDDGIDDCVERGMNARGADLFISLHSNASNDNVCDGINYVTVFYPYDGMNESEKHAGTIAENVENALYMNGVDLSPWQTKTRRGSRGEWYGVMRGARSVGVPLYFICESGFHTNAKTAVALLNPETLTDIAVALTLSIGGILGLHTRDYVPGDVNGNGKIDPQDYAMLKRYLLGTYQLTDEQIKRADIDGDGHLTPKDYAMIKRKYLNG